MKKKKGMTLIELIVTISSASIMILTLVSSVFFISKVSNEVTTDASTNLKILAIKDHMINHTHEIYEENKDIIDVIDELQLYSYKINDDSVMYNGENLIKCDRITAIEIICRNVDNNGSIVHEFTYTIKFNGSYGEDSLVFTCCE